jgi:hypothetical protein
MPDFCKAAILILGLLLFSGCKINQRKNHLREGRWIEQFTSDSINYKSVGKYRRDEEIKTWKYFAGNKLVKKEVYENGICLVTNYHKNGKTASIGKTKSQLSETGRHWFYFGDWIFYDEHGTIELIRKYENGELINETQMN